MRFQEIRTPEDDWRRRMRELRFRFGKWDLDVRGKETVPRGALLLTRGEHGAIVAAAEALARLADRARARLAQDPAALAGLGVHARIAPLLRDERQGPLVTRLDFFQTRDGWRVSEFNDDCPGGYNEAIGLPATLAGLVDGAGVAGDLPAALARLAVGRGGDGGDGAVGIVYATGYAEDLQVARLLSALFEAQGLRTVGGAPDGLEAGTHGRRLQGADVGTLFRFFPVEWMPELPNLDAWAAAARQGGLVNPLACAATQSKAVFHWLEDNATGSDRALVRSHLPATRTFTPALAQEALDRREALVLKPFFGRMGEGVSLGREWPPAAWAKRVAAVARLARVKPYVLQDRFDAVPVEVAPGRTATPCVGAYVVAGKFAGYYSRLSPKPPVAYDAANVLTLVEGL